MRVGVSYLARLQQVLTTALPESIYLLRGYQDHIAGLPSIFSAPLSSSPRLRMWSKRAEEREGRRED